MARGLHLCTTTYALFINDHRNHHNCCGPFLQSGSNMASFRLNFAGLAQQLVFRRHTSNLPLLPPSFFFTAAQIRHNFGSISNCSEACVQEAHVQSRTAFPPFSFNSGSIPTPFRLNFESSSSQYVGNACRLSEISSGPQGVA